MWLTCHKWHLVTAALMYQYVLNSVFKRATLNLMLWNVSIRLVFKYMYVYVCILITLEQFRKPWYYRSILYALFQPISCATSFCEVISRMATMFEHRVEEECDFTRNLSTIHQSHCRRYQQIQNYHRSLVSSFGVILVENSMPFPTMNDDGLPTRTPLTISLNRHRQDYIFFAKSRDIL